MTSNTSPPGDLIDLYQRTVQLLDQMLASHRSTNARVTANSKAILDIVQLLNEKGVISRAEANDIILSLKTTD